MRNVPNKVVGDTYTSQELNEGGLDEDKHMITDTLQNFDHTSVSQKIQAVILAAGNRLTYIENTGSTGAAYKIKNLQSTSDQAKFIQNGFKFTLIFTNKNTVINPTIEFNGILGTYNITDKDSNPITLNLFKKNSIVEFVYNGTNLIVASILTSQEDINKNNSYTSVYTSPNYLLTNNITNPIAYYNGMVVNFIAHNKSNAAVTLTIDGLSQVSLIKGNGEVSYNDILSNSVVSSIYYNGNFYLLNSKDNFNVNSQNTYSIFDKDNISRKSAFNVGGIKSYNQNETLSALQSHQKIKIYNNQYAVQLTLPKLSTCDDNYELDIMILSSYHAASFVAHQGDRILYNSEYQSSINLAADNAMILIKKDNLLDTWFVSGHAQSTVLITGVSKHATDEMVEKGISTLTTVVPSALRKLLLKIVEPVGQVNYFYAQEVPNNYILMNGSHWLKTTYPELWLKLNGLPNVSSDNTRFWINSSSTRFTRATSATNIVGSIQEDAIRNITGNVGHIIRRGTTDGSFEQSGNESSDGTDGNNFYYQVDFDASRVVPTAPENRPVDYALLQCIKYTLGF